MRKTVFDKTQYIVVLVMAGAVSLTYFLGQLSRTELVKLNSFSVPLMSKAKDAKAVHNQQWTLYEDAVLTGELDPITEATKKAEVCRKAISEIAEQSDLPQVKNVAREQSKLVGATAERAADVYARLAKDEQGDKIETAVAELAKSRKDLDAGFSRIEDLISLSLQQGLRRVQHRDRYFLAFQLVLVLGSVMAVFILIQRLVTKPLEQLVTERTEQLSQSEERIRQLVENMSSGVSVFDFSEKEDDFYFKEINQGVEAIEQVERKDVVGRKLTEIFPSAREMGIFDVLKKVYETGVPEHMQEHLYKDERIEGWRENYVFKLPSGEVVSVYDDVTQKHEYEQKMDAMNQELQRASMEAGMAQIASGVLHNVGNVLTSLRTTGQFLERQIKKLQIENFQRCVAVLEENEGNLADFLMNDPKGAKLVQFLKALSQRQSTLQEALLNDAVMLMSHVEHIEEIVRTQQDYARAGQFVESSKPSELIEDVLKLNRVSLSRHHINIVPKVKDDPVIQVQKHKVLQILTNFIRNAKAAVSGMDKENKKVEISAQTIGDDIEISVIDNGVGIDQQDLVKIFSHGFTTKKDGHGFGLHSCANAAKELGGVIEATSEGPGKGACFALTLPIEPKSSNAGRPARHTMGNQ